MADDTYYMKQAALLEAGRAADKGEVPVGAVVVCRDRIIARAHNLTETLNDVTAHAEMQAITAAANALGGKYLNDCALYVTVEISERLCIVCHSGAVCDVCRCHSMVTAGQTCIWSFRREARVYEICS